MRPWFGTGSKSPLAFVSNALELPDDEGTRRFAHLLAGYASTAGVPVFAVSGSDPLYVRKLLLGSRPIRNIRESGAKVVIYLPIGSASVGGLLRVAVLRARTKVRVVMLAVQPRPMGVLGQAVARALAPDLVLTPSTSFVDDLRRFGLRAAFVPMGVDPVRFAPVDVSTKKSLRTKYGVPEDARIVLHVGHLKERRNLEWLVRVQETIHSTTLVVSGGATGVDARVFRRLATAGVHIIGEYVPKVEEVYQLADAYLFPTIHELGAVAVPLSVLEAMACNLPVVTTPFGGLPQMFKQGDGLFYASNQHDFVESVQTALALPRHSTRTREKVLPYSWTKVFAMILEKANQVALQSPDHRERGSCLQVETVADGSGQG